MGKTLVIAEKPSVGRDIAAALPGAFTQSETSLESDEYVVTWAVGHLVELAQPEDYDEKLKKWRMVDLPIVPEDFQLKPRDAKSKKQLTAIRKLLDRPDVDRVINACDAGREGELIFAYIYESAGATKPVDRLWISSMTKQAIREGFERLRPGSQLAPLEAAARSRSEADWLVGMNATRAATIRGRAWVGGVVSLGRVQTPTLALIVKREREIQAFVPEPYWLVPAQFDPPYQGVWVEHDVDRFSPDERRVFDLVARRFLAVFHPPARYARTTVVTLVEEERFRTRGKVTLEAGWRGVYGLEADADKQARQDEDAEDESAELPPLEQGQKVRCAEAEVEARETKPPPRYTEATLLSAMERAGKDLQPTPKGLQVITMLEEHPLTSPELTGDWEKRLTDIEHGREDRGAFIKDIAGFTEATVEKIAALDKEKLRPERVELGLCPRCGAETGEIIKENSKAYGCTSWKSREEAGCGFVIWKRVAGRTLTPEIARQLLEEGRTREVLSGFKSRAGKPFRARLVLNGEGKVEFDFPARPQRDGDSAQAAETPQTAEPAAAE